MPERPLLIFPTPQPVDRAKRKSFPVLPHVPSVSRQGQRLAPRFRELQEAFDARRVEIQQSSTGIEPEQVLVIETVGSVENFANAVKRIPGLEWMGEIESDQIVPDQDFYDNEHPEKTLNGRLYLLMSNQQALNQMLSLWNNCDKPNIEFEYGLTKFRDVFRYMKDIHRWDVRDRLHDTGVMDYWKEDLKHDANRRVIFEVELWFRRSSELRSISEKRVINLIQQAEGQVYGQSVIEGIAYHALLAELPAHAIRSIIEHPATELVKCEDIMFFRPVGQIVEGDKLVKDELEIEQLEEKPLPEGEPVIALFDGLPLTNHALLADRLIVDDPDHWEAEYSASKRIHGSAMASLIIHGDLNQSQAPLSRPIYVRPIMKPISNVTFQQEGIPENCLMVDLIHRAVKRLFEGEQGENGVSPHIKVINLSIGDPSHQFMQSMSPLARLLDWLSVKYNVLFIVSAGNHPEEISLNVTKKEYDNLQPEKFEELIIKALYKDVRNRKLLSPAETINGITVGAVHFDSVQSYHQGNRINPFKNLLPSPVSAFGNGYRRAIKPDIIFFGGRQLYGQSLLPMNPVVIKPVSSRKAPGNKVASPGSGSGELNATAYSCGTSNAAALISRAAGICYDSLLQIFHEYTVNLISPNCEIPLLKAMLVHGCSWGEMGEKISAILCTPENGRQLRGMVSQWIGYGMPDIGRVLDCTEHRATVIGFGELSDGNAHVFNLPLPASLEGRRVWRRLTVTLAWLSPTLPKNQKYRVASLWFEVENTLNLEQKDVDLRTVQRGTVQHEVLEGKSAIPFIDKDNIEIKVNCRQDAGKIFAPVAYGLIVSLEVAEDVNIDVYNEIKTRIAPMIQIQQSVN